MEEIRLRPSRRGRPVRGVSVRARARGHGCNLWDSVHGRDVVLLRRIEEMYGLPGYGRMIADPVRMTAYEAALRRVVGPGSVVADIGAGPGIMSLIACRLGA